jgi:hypothetical protein
MNKEELYEALMTECPVFYTDYAGHRFKYKKVSAVVVTKEKGKKKISAELLDFAGRSKSLVAPERLSLK